MTASDTTTQSKNPPYSIDKITAAVVHIEAATLLVLRNEAPEAAHSLLAAAKTVLWDLGKEQNNSAIKLFDDAVTRRLRPGKEREWRFHMNRAANFFKHADRDPEAQLSGVNLEKVNEMDLLILVLVAGEFIGKLTPRMTIALCYAGFRSGDWFDFESYVAGVNGNTMDFEHYAKMSEAERNGLFLEAYDRLEETRPSRAKPSGRQASLS